MPKVTRFNKNKFLDKYVLKKGTALTLAGVTALSVGAAAIKSHFDVQVPENYIYEVVDVEVGQKYKVNVDEKDDIVFIKTSDWTKGKNETTIKNIKTCNENNIPCGIIVESNSVTINDAKSDASVLMSTIDGLKIDCPIYYDINHLNENLTNGEINEVCSSFENNISDEYKVAYLGDSYALTRLDNDKKYNGNILVTDEKEINTALDYDVCYFSRTNKYYSNSTFGLDLQNNNDNYMVEYVNEANDDEFKIDDIVLTKDGKYVKGVDVSKHQGTIDWKEFKEQGVGFAIIRYSGFLGYKSSGVVPVDEKFESNVKGCIDNDIPFGIYYYSTARTVQQAINEAEEMSKIMGNYKDLIDLPLYVDIEKFNEGEQLNCEEAAKWYVAARDVLKEAHPDLEVALYASKSIYDDMCYYNPDVKGDKDWIAVYPYDNYEKNNGGLEFDNITVDNVRSDGHIVQLSQYGNLDGAYLDNGDPGGTVDFNVMTTEDYEEMTTGRSK